jgi:type VI secretion system protein ImpE
VTAKELLEAGRLSAAIEQLNDDVRSHPTDVRQRTFLFELLCFAGEYQRAARQLDVIEHQDATAEIGVQAYRHILTAEEARDALFSQGRQPRFLFSPPPYVYPHLEAVNQLRQAQPAAAKALLEQAVSTHPRLSGHVDGQVFDDFCDSDAILGPFLEVFVQNDYVWFPLEQIKQLTIPLPTHLRDLLWTPARLEAHSGPVGDVFLPVLYPGSCRHDDDRIKLGRLTDWLDGGDGLARGTGQHLFLVGEDGRALLEMRELVFDARATPTEDA